MNVENKTVLHYITSDRPGLSEVIKDSIGAATDKKILKILQSYNLLNRYLIGAFLSTKLVAVIGFIVNTKEVTIKHICVLKNYRN